MNKEAYLFCKFMNVEIRKIDLDKYFQGIKQHSDPGNEFIIEWIKNNGCNWRRDWDVSKCKHCSKWKECGHFVKTDCINFIIDEIEDIDSIDDDIIN